MSVDPITCHILDTNKGKPATGVLCQLYRLGDINEEITDVSTVPEPVAMAHTDNDGRIKKWTLNPNLDAGVKQKLGGWKDPVPGIYKIKFLTGKYFLEQKSSTFFPYVDIHFVIADPADAHYHIPLLLSNHSYTTYRGS